MTNLEWVLRTYSRLLEENPEEAEKFRKQMSHHEWAFKACEELAKALSEMLT